MTAVVDHIEWNISKAGYYKRQDVDESCLKMIKTETYFFRGAKNMTIDAEKEEIIQLKKELEIKTVSQLCAERGATSVSAFDNCVGGKSRISQNQENPLFFCCK